jgi:hypothetical protein
MNRSFVFTRAALAVIGLLLLVGPQKANAQTIFTCVNPTTGLIQVVAQNATCPPNWNKTTLSTTPGVLAGAAFQCTNQTVLANGPLAFVASLSNINFGSAISPGQTPPSTSFLLQPGIYQIHFSGEFTTSSSNLISALVAGESQAGWYAFGGGSNPIFVGDRLISVSLPNTVFGLVSNLGATVAPACELVITKLQ